MVARRGAMRQAALKMLIESLSEATQLIRYHSRAASNPGRRIGILQEPRRHRAESRSVQLRPRVIAVGDAIGEGEGFGDFAMLQIRELDIQLGPSRRYSHHRGPSTSTRLPRSPRAPRISANAGAGVR